MVNRNHRRKWEIQRDAAIRDNKPIPPYKDKAVSAGTKSYYLSFIRSLLRAATNERRWIKTAPVIKTKKPVRKRIRWLIREEANRLIECMPEGMKPVVIFALANAAWRIGLQRAGIEDFRFHDLRHTWAGWLIQAGVPLSALQEMGEWESIEMVRRYAHLAPNHLTEHARKINSILGDNDTNTTQGGNQPGLRIA